MSLTSGEYLSLFENVGSFVAGIRGIEKLVKSVPSLSRGAISAITEANPAVVTSNAHGLSHGDKITIVGVGGMTELNNRDFIVGNPTTNTFELLGEDSTGHTTYTSGGTWVRCGVLPNLNLGLANIESVLGDNDRNDVLSGVPELFAGYRAQAVGWIDTLASRVDQLLTHREDVLEKLPGLQEGASVLNVLPELYRDMVAGTESVQRSTVTIGSPSAAAGNTGNGTILTTKVLDGVTEPHPGWPANRNYDGADTELSVTENMTYTCVLDEDSDGEVEGEETFLIEGAPGSFSPYAPVTEGSGTSRNVTTMNRANLLSNKNFEVWASQAPVGWVVETGTPGTHIIQETSLSNVYRGANALKLAGNGALAAIRLSQPVPFRNLLPRKRYCLSFRVKASATISAGTLLVRLEDGSGNLVGTSGETSSGSGAQVEIAHGSLPTNYTLHHFFFTMPASVPTNLELIVQWGNTPQDTKELWLDSMALDEVRYANGFGSVIVAGSTQFVRGDRFTVAVTNNDKGLFQTFFRKRYRAQLPSSNTPSLSDLLAC